MTERKLSINGWGYAIAKQILDAFAKAKIRPKIIYKRKDLNTHYITNRTKFQTRSIFRDDDHQQYWLPLKNWKAVNGMPNEVYNLPKMTVDKWLKTKKKKPGMVVEDYSIPSDVKLRLKKIFEEKYATN